MIKPPGAHSHTRQILSHLYPFFKLFSLYVFTQKPVAYSLRQSLGRMYEKGIGN